MTTDTGRGDASTSRLPARVRRLVLAISLGGAAATALVLGVYGSGIPVDAGDVAFALAVAIASSLVGVHLHLRGTRRNITLDEIGWATAVVLLPATPALLVILAAGLIEQIVQRRPPVKFVFNLGHAALAATVTVVIVAQLGGPGFGVRTIVVVLAAILASSLVNIATFVALVGRLSAEPWWPLFREELGINLLTAGSGGAIGLLAAFLWLESPALLPMLLAPALMVRATGRTRERAARELAAERDRLTRAIEGIGDGIALVDRDGRVVVANDSFTRIAGLSPGDDVTSLLSRIRPKELHDGGVRSFEGTLGDLVVRLVRQPVGGVTRGGEVIQVQDVTRQREIEQLREELVSRVSHELRTPLTAVNGAIETVRLHGAELPDATRTALLEAAERNGRRLERLVSTLLQRSRLDHAVTVTHPSEVDVAQVVTRVLQELPELGASAEVQPGLLVLADIDHVHQILENLLVNADRYGAPPIVVRAAGSIDGAVAIRVEDDGPGVPDAFREEMFEAFSQASTGTRREAQGLGLGLEIVRRLTEANGGSVSYEPRSPGACFVIRLPAVPRAVAAQVPSSEVSRP